MSRYKAGLVNFFVVMQAGLIYQASTLTMVQSEAILSLNAVALYKALGGGWQIDRSCWMQSEPLVLWPDTED